MIGPSAFDVVDPIFVGAGHQGGRCSGTMATELIAGFGEACRLVSDSGVEERNRVAKIRDVFVRDLAEHVDAELVGSLENRHPGNALMRFPGVNRHAIVTLNRRATLTPLTDNLFVAVTGAAERSAAA